MTGCGVRRPPFKVFCGRAATAHVVLMCAHEHRKELDVCSAHLARTLMCKPCLNAGHPRVPLTVVAEQAVVT